MSKKNKKDISDNFILDENIPNNFISSVTFSDIIPTSDFSKDIRADKFNEINEAREKFFNYYKEFKCENNESNNNDDENKDTDLNDATTKECKNNNILSGIKTKLTVMAKKIAFVK